MARRRPSRKETGEREPPVAPPNPAPHKPPKQALRFAAWLVSLGAVCLFYGILKMYGLHPSIGDEHIYLYQSKLISEGVAPYSGFAMAHPPLQMIFTAALFKLFGYHLMLGRVLPMAWWFLGGVLLAWMVRRELGAVASISAAALTLLAYEPLRASSHYTGVNMTVTLLIAAVFAYRTGRIRTSAALSVAAVFTRLYASPGVLVLALFALAADRRAGFRLIAWGAGLGLAALLAVGFWAGFGDLFDNLLRYHAQKTPMQPEQLARMHDTVLYHNALEAAVFALSLPALIAAVARAYRGLDRERRFLPRLAAAVRESGAGLPVLCAGIAIIVLFVLLRMDRVWMYYYIPSFPFAAVASGWLISRWAVSGWRLVASRGRLAEAGLSPARLAGGALLLALLGAAYVYSPRLEARLEYYKKAMERDPAGRISRYPWVPGYLPDPVDRAVKALFWRDERVIGEDYNRFTHLLWHETASLDILDETVKIIEENTRPDGEIFGDSGTVPLFALLSGRRIAANEVDTNIQRYASGHTDPAELVKKIDNPRTEMIILNYRFGVGGVRAVLDLVEQKYRLLGKLKPKDGGLFLLYKRR